MEWPTPHRYLLHLLTREALAVELHRPHHTSRQEADHRTSHRALSTREPQVRQSLVAKRNASLQETANTLPEQYLKK